MYMYIYNSFLLVGSAIFRQVIGIPVGPDYGPFSANLLFFNESKRFKSIKDANIEWKEN